MARTSNWILKTTFALAGIGAFLAVSFGESRADIVHSSTEDYYAPTDHSDSATQVTNCDGEGCSGASFTFGNAAIITPANLLWGVPGESVDRDTFADGTDFTTFAYEVANVNLDQEPGSVFFLTGFHVAHNGFVASAFNAPENWTFSQDLTYWNWQTTSPSSGIQEGDSLGGFQATVFLPVSVGFNTTFVDGKRVTDPQFFQNTQQPANFETNWLVSGPEALLAVPEPASLLLLGSGLAGLGLWRRWHA